MAVPESEPKELEGAFRCEVLKLLKDAGRINDLVINNKGEQMVRYYVYYSNKSRGMHKKTDTDMLVPALIDTEISKRHPAKTGRGSFRKFIMLIRLFVQSARER